MSALVGDAHGMKHNTTLRNMSQKMWPVTEMGVLVVQEILHIALAECI